MPQKIWTADAQGNKNYFNRTCLDYTGFTFEEVKDWGWEKMVHPDDWKRTKEMWQESINTGKDFEIENRLRRKDGKFLWHLTRAIAIQDEVGKIKIWIGSKTEIQEQREQKEELEKAVNERTQDLQIKNEELKSINAELESFAYVCSHDLQEPLRKIQIFTGRLLENENQHLSDKGKKDFESMRKSAKRMQTLIEDLLAYSRLGTADKKFEIRNLNIIVEEVIAGYKETIEEKNATIDATELGSANIIPFQFHQLMHNIIGNALKFSKPNLPPHITIKSKIINGSQLKDREPDAPQDRFTPEEKYCHISITDNGIGFEMEFDEKIFEVFQKLHSSDEYTGTGIGLAIVKKIVDNHNGFISVTSELNKGTRFNIYIPG
jgi:two-component system, chemotaxis family, CheB/CheR fusion protein